MFRKGILRSRGLRILAVVFVAFSLVAGRAADRGAARTGGARPGAAADTAPNIILILTDDEDVQLGSVDYMPNVKKLLAAQGVSFSNMYVPLSLCCPSRTTILRGQYPHNTGVLTNNLPNGGFEKAFAQNLESATIATVLHGAGYRTVLLGKYLNGYPDTAPAYLHPARLGRVVQPVRRQSRTREYNYTMNENGTLKTYGATPADYLTDVIRAKAVDFIKRVPASGSRSSSISRPTRRTRPTRRRRATPRFSRTSRRRGRPTFNEPDTTDKPDYIKTRPLLTQKEIDNIDEDYRNRLRALQAVDEAIARPDRHARLDRPPRQHLHLLHLGQRLPHGRAPPPAGQVHALRDRPPHAARRPRPGSLRRASCGRNSPATSTSRRRSRISPARRRCPSSTAGR